MLTIQNRLTTTIMNARSAFMLIKVDAATRMVNADIGMRDVLIIIHVQSHIVLSPI
jgi:hypothetical protein